MKIQEISDTIDTKLQKLELELLRLASDRDNSNNDAEKAVFQSDIESLHKIKTKLIKSKAVAWQAHNLRVEIEPKKDSRSSWWWLAAMLGLLGFVLYQMYSQ